MKIFRAILLAVLVFSSLPVRAQQSAPNWTFNYVPTPAEWSFWFGKKVDFAGALPCIVTGCAFTGSISTTGTITTGAVGGSNGTLNLNGSTSGGSTIGVNSIGVLSIATAQGNGTFFNDGGNGSAFIVGSAGGAIANRITTTPSLTGFGPSIGASGSDTNVTMRVNAQGSGGFLFTGGGGMSIDGNTPTSCSSTGSGTGPSCALEAGSNNSVGRIQITTGTTPGSSGTFTITFANVIIGANNPVCMFLYNDTGTAWNAGALPMHLTSTSTSVITATWNNTVALTASSGYKIDYHCFGK